jgi:hypothetical protein
MHVMEHVKVASTITLFTFLIALTVWAATRPRHHSDCGVGVRRPDPVARERPVLDSLRHDIEELDRRVVAAVDALVITQTHTDREAAKARLQELRREQWKLQRRLAEAKCHNDPLAKGCL